MTQQSPPDNYYLNYFKKMVDVVYQRYEDILPLEDLEFLQKIKLSSEPSLRLLVRLYLRKGPNFIVNKLRYNEVPDIQLSINELVDLGLVESNPLVYAYELIEILPIAQSRLLFSDDPKCRKSDLIDAWIDDENLQTCTDWEVSEAIVAPTHYETLRRLQLLYFGNERQNLTDFILEDLGLFKYEQYRLDKANRMFGSLDDIEQLMSLNDLRAEFYLMNELKQWENLSTLAEQSLNLNLPTNLTPTWHRFLNRLAYRLEQLGELDSAKAIFESNQQPPARERLVRILYKQAHYKQAMSILESIHSSPLSADEVQFYRRFVNKLRSKSGLPKIDLTPPSINTIYASWPRGEGTVEQQAAIHFEGAVWLENNLPLAIFGLLYWSAIFADVPGVWHHPFQYKPTDLTDPEFSTRRVKILKNIALKSKAEWRDIIENHWQEKYGLRNPFVNWTALDITHIIDCFDSLTKDQWLGVFTHLLSDIRQYRSGFPDLFQKTNKGYRFIEIKGPGDKLQDNQIAWLEKFNELSIFADVCYVQYLNA